MRLDYYYQILLKSSHRTLLAASLPGQESGQQDKLCARHFYPVAELSRGSIVISPRKSDALATFGALLLITIKCFRP